ncbi:MAG: hypothetical protein ACM33U_09150 [Solirubrobacterales bacterium]|nr:hypothetical protein [Solirubrobacterales bacterium]
MARTAEGRLLTEQHRVLQLRLRAQALLALQAIWRGVSPEDLAATIGPFATAAGLLVLARRRDSAALAGRYFREFRRVEGVPGSFEIAADQPPGAELATGLVRGAALSGIINARRAGQSPQAAAANGFVKAAGAASQLVLGGGRRTILDAIDADREAQGWQRVPSGKACAFCSMLVSRGATYKSEASAGFRGHDHCACGAEPFYEGSQPLPGAERLRALWNETGDLNSFRKALAA